MDFKSSSINITEREVLRERGATVDVVKTGGILECNWGEALVQKNTSSIGNLANTFGDVDEYNVKNYMNAANYLRYASNLTLVRPIPSDARNNSLKFVGATTPQQSKSVELLHNQKVAKNSLDELISVSDAELEVYHRFVTTKENVAVAICSSEDHWDQPISNERIPAIRDIDMSITPISLANGETYSVKPVEVTYLSTGYVTDALVSTIVLPTGALPTGIVLAEGDVVTISGDTNSGNNEEWVVKSYNTEARTVTVAGVLTAGSNTTGKLSYVIGKLGRYVDASESYTITAYDDGAHKITIDKATVGTWAAGKCVKIVSAGAGLSGIYKIDSVAVVDGKLEVTLVNATVMPDVSIGTNDKAFLLTITVLNDIVSYNTNGYLEFEKPLFTNGKMVFIEKKGYITTITGGIIPSTATATLYRYLPVDENKDGIAEYAIRQVYKSYLYNSDKSLKSFKSTVNFTPNFLKGDFVVFVFLKDSKDGKFDLVEKHLLSSDPSAKLSTGKTKFAEEVIFNDSKYIYLKVGSYDYSVTSAAADAKAIVFPDTKFLAASYLASTITLTNGTISATYTIDSVDYTTKTITTTVNLSTMTGAITATFDSSFGKVSTNVSKNTPLEIKGFSIDALTLKEPSDTSYSGKSYSMSNTWNALTPNVVTESDFNNAADIFADKDNVDVQFLISFATKDGNNILHQDKMASIAKVRENCLAVNGLLDAKDVVGKTNAFISQYIVDSFGTKRSDMYNGLFTEFSPFTSCYNNMVKQYVPVLDKTVYVSQIGEIIGMLTQLISTKGLGTALAGVENGVIRSSKNLLWDPSREDKDLMSKNNINTVCWSKTTNSPIINEQVTSTLDDDSNFRDQDIRVSMNVIKDFLGENLVYKLWKKNTPLVRESLITLIKPFFDQLYQDGVLEVPATIICDSTNNTGDVIKANTLKVAILLIFTKSIRTIDIDIVSYDSGMLTISESER